MSTPYKHGYLAAVYGTITRTKDVRQTAYTDRHTNQKYTTWVELTNHGVGCLPLVVFVASGQIAKDVAGPSSCLSILVAAIATVLSGLNYAELRSRVPRAQTTVYDYLFCVVGELIAFLTGWISLLQLITCSSAMARAASSYMDYMLQFRVENTTIKYAGRLDFIDSYLDFVALLLMIFVVILLSVGIQPWTKLGTLIANVVAAIVFVFSCVVSLFRIDFQLWSTPQQFFPHGAQGVFQGAALFMSGLSFYDVLLLSADFTSDTVKKPLFIATALTFSSGIVASVCIASVTSLLKTSFMSEAPFGEAFDGVDLYWIRYILAPAMLFIFTPYTIFTFHRLVKYLTEISSDGLVHSGFNKCHSGMGTPILAIVPLGVTSGVLALFFNLTSLIQISSWCCIVVQIAVAVVILFLRHVPAEKNNIVQKITIKRKRRKDKGNQNNVAASRGQYGTTSSKENNAQILPSANPFSIEQEEEDYQQIHGQNNNLSPIRDSGASTQGSTDSSSDTDIDEAVEEYRVQELMSSETCSLQQTGLFQSKPTLRSYRVSKLYICIFLLLTVIFAAIIIHSRPLYTGNVGLICVSVLVGVGIVVVFIGICIQPRETVLLKYYQITVPGVPVLPLLTVFICVHLLQCLPPLTWITGSLWSIAGILVYVIYGFRNNSRKSVYELLPEEQRRLVVDDSAASQNINSEDTARESSANDEALLNP